jgi:hypothetical protein
MFIRNNVIFQFQPIPNIHFALKLCARLAFKCWIYKRYILGISVEFKSPHGLRNASLIEKVLWELLSVGFKEFEKQKFKISYRWLFSKIKKKNID